MSKVLETTRRGTWALGLVSITSCLGRNDYNVVFSILTLLILDNFYNSSPKVTSKIIIQIFAILTIADILWIIYFSGAWTHLSKEEREKINIGDSEDIINFWDSLWFIHGLVYFLAFIELILKGLLLYYLIMDYNGKYSWKDLLNLNYDSSAEKVTSHEDENQLFKTIINKFFARFPKALNPIEELIISFLDQEFNKTKKLFTDLSEMNFTYLYVDELSKEYKTLIQDSLLKKSFQNQGTDQNNMNNQNNNFPFKENKDISFFKSNKDKDKDSYYQGLANYVKSLVDFIYSEMIRNLREYIPKATGNFFIKSLKSNMNFYLLQYISKNPEICQDLEEDQDVAQKRIYYIDAQKKLKKINKTIGLDEQIAKFFKEDNIKSIETILEAQGINTQANKEKEEQEKEKEKEKEKNAKKTKN